MTVNTVLDLERKQRERQGERLEGGEREGDGLDVAPLVTA